ncbi:MAG: hypothetical protein LQ343_000562 [Gyalolechia ehrenbergii]|nr:MAG: hypothetical protein LQ343_000562 [Gyalolechia ehrenbergii]
MPGTITKCSALRVQKRRRNTQKSVKNTLKILPYLTPSTLTTILPSKSPVTTTLPPFPILNRFFSPKTVHQATHLPSPPAHHTSTPLSNPIHPIFRPSNFPTLNHEHYTSLAPALTLASRFLTSPLTFSWWVKLILAHPIPHPYIPNATVLSDVEDNLENRIKSYTRLHAHARDVTFRFRDEIGGFASTHVVAVDALESQQERRRVERRKEKRLVYLDTRFETYILTSLSCAEKRRRKGGDATDRAQDLRFHFLLALNLVHELAHTLCPPSSSGSRCGEEPFHSPHDPRNELGASWESHTFGGKIQPVAFDVECKAGLMWFPWSSPQEEGRWMREGRGRFWGLEMGWVAGLFGEGVWRGMEVMASGEMVRVCGEGVREPFVEMDVRW